MARHQRTEHDGGGDERPDDGPSPAERDMARASDPPERGEGHRPAMNPPGPDADRDEGHPLGDVGRAEPYEEAPESLAGAVGPTDQAEPT